MNGIQEVSGSIPLISTKKETVTIRWLFLFALRSSRTADLLQFKSGSALLIEAQSASISGSIPLLSA